MTSVIRWIAVFPLVGFVSAAETEWRELFNGTDLSAWTKTITGRPVGADPDGLVQVLDGEIHMYPDTPEGTTVPFGVIPHEEELREIGKLAACSGDFPDAHQALLPPLEQDVARIEFAPGNAPFGFYMEGHAHVSFTDPSRPSKATIPRTARVYPIRSFQGKVMRNTWAIGFEEAKNGDYQDAVLMVENMVPVVDK